MQNDVSNGREEHELQYILFQLEVFPTMNSGRILKEPPEFHKKGKRYHEHTKLGKNFK